MKWSDLASTCSHTLKKATTASFFNKDKQESQLLTYFEAQKPVRALSLDASSKGKYGEQHLRLYTCAPKTKYAYAV